MLVGILVAAVLVVVYLRRPDFRARVDLWARRVRPWQVGLAAVILLALVVDTRRSELNLVLGILAVFAVVMAIEWNREFGFLMRLPDDAFPGHNDKLIWAILLIVLPPVGLWLFRSHRLSHWPESKAAKPSGFEELF